MEQSRIIQEFKKQKSHYVYYSIFRVCVHRKSHLKSSIKKRKLSACTSGLAVLSFISIQYFIKFWLRLPIFSVFVAVVAVVVVRPSIDCICWFVYFTISSAQIGSTLLYARSWHAHIGSIQRRTCGLNANICYDCKYAINLFDARFYLQMNKSFFSNLWPCTRSKHEHRTSSYAIPRVTGAALQCKQLVISFKQRKKICFYILHVSVLFFVCFFSSSLYITSIC